MDAENEVDGAEYQWCRALYNYTASDASALSFQRGDIIEVLSKQASGWWDGLLGDERGWFPSNYVETISEEEAEQAFQAAIQQQPQENGPAAAVTATAAVAVPDARASMIDMSHAMMAGSQAENEDWLNEELANTGGLEALAQAAIDGPSQPNDFWMPQVTPGGQIYYVNTQTGQQSRDLPRDAVDATADDGVYGLTASQSSSRSGTSAGLGFTNSDSSLSSTDLSTPSANFGIPRSTGTPEPWVRRLADDGMSYYYYNKQDQSVQWTRPEAVSVGGGAPAKTPVKGLAPPMDGAGKRYSMYSDSSDISPFDEIIPGAQIRGHANGRPANPQPRQTPPAPTQSDLTSAERLAESLQKALEPPAPEIVTDLSAVARNSIHAITTNIRAKNRKADEDQRMDQTIYAVVLAVRNLLYVSAAPTGQIPASVIPKEARDPKQASSTTSPLKPAQRKVTATLSRLVLSARAMQYDSGSVLADTLNRIEVDAEELERAIMAFVIEVQRLQNSTPRGEEPRKLKRLHGVFLTANIGLGLVGAGVAASWTGFGFVAVDEIQAPQRSLGSEVIAEVGSSLSGLAENFMALGNAIKASAATPVEQVRSKGQTISGLLSTFLSFISTIHVAQHVDIDGMRQESQDIGSELYVRYMETVERNRSLIRMLEAAMQHLYDEGTKFLLTVQSLRELEPGQSRRDRDAAYEHIDALSTSLKSNLAVVQQTLEGLYTCGQDQAELAQGDYNGSITARLSRLSAIDAQFGGMRRSSAIRVELDDYYGGGGGSGEMLDMGMAMMPGGRRTVAPYNDVAVAPPLPPPRPGQEQRQEMNGVYGKASGSQTSASDLNEEMPSDGQGEMMMDEDEYDSDLDGLDPPGQRRQPAKNSKLAKLLGDEYQPASSKNSKLAKLLGSDFQAASDPISTPPKEEQPWYLRPDYDPKEIIVEADSTVRGGTVPALVARLTAHEHQDSAYLLGFTRAFLITFKSFTTVDELFDLLVQRFWINPPTNLAPQEREQWGRLKQRVVQARVLNTLRSLISDDDVLDKDDMHILDRIKDFAQTKEVLQINAARTLLNLVERIQRGEQVKMTKVVAGNPPQPIMPKSNKKLKLLDVEPLEMARQLTILESRLYQKIKPIECLTRSREQKAENMDNIAVVIQTSNRIADWVAESILTKEDSRRRAAAVKHLISIADRCRTMNNFSTMIAITSGLNTPPIRRLKRTWEQVNQKVMAQFGACERTIDSSKNFNKYRQLMASVTPPCVPFIGVFLSTLQFIQDGNPDMIQGTNMVNFKKRQKASEVIADIQRWQSQSFNFQPIPSIQAFIEESLNQFSDTRTSSDHFWALSLEREPREREDEKMARLLQESGFL